MLVFHRAAQSIVKMFFFTTNVDCGLLQPEVKWCKHNTALLGKEKKKRKNKNISTSTFIWLNVSLQSSTGLVRFALTTCAPRCPLRPAT